MPRRMNLLAIFPRQDITSAVRHFNSGHSGASLDLIGWSLWCALRASCCPVRRAFRGSLQIWNPPQERREVCHIDDVPNFLGGVPTGSQCLDGIFLSERRYQIDSHTANYRCDRMPKRQPGCALQPVPNRQKNLTLLAKHEEASSRA